MSKRNLHTIKLPQCCFQNKIRLATFKKAQVLQMQFPWNF